MVFSLIVPLFVVIALGYVLKKTKFLPRSFAGDLNKLIYFIGLPALLFQKTSQIDFSGYSFGSVSAGYPIVVVVTALLTLPVSILVRKESRGAVIQAAYRANLAYMGFPIVVSALGDGIAALAAMIVGVGNVINSVLAVIILRMLGPEGESDSVWRKLVQTVANPLIIATVLGLLSSAVGLRLPSTVNNAIGLVAGMSLPAILVVIGMSLSFTEMRAYAWPASLASGFKLVVMPLFAYYFMRVVFGMGGKELGVIVVMAAMPTAVAAQSFAAGFKADEKVTASAISLNTVLSAVTLPLWLYILGWG